MEQCWFVLEFEVENWDLVVALIQDPLALFVCKVPPLARLSHDAKYLHGLRGHWVTLTGFSLDLVDLVYPSKWNACHFTTAIQFLVSSLVFCDD